MKNSIVKRVNILMLSVMMLQPVAYAAQLNPYTDDVITNFTLTDIDKQTHSLTDYRGKVVLINFWASWCTPCLLEMPSMKRLQQTLADQDFVLLTLNTTDKPRRIRETLKRLQVDMTVLLDHDSKTLKAWHGRVLPSSYLLDRNGQVQYRAVGGVDWDDEGVIISIKQLIKRP